MRGSSAFRALLLVFLCGYNIHGEEYMNTAEDSLVRKLSAVCGKDGIKVTVSFSQPFTGVVYSDGHYDTPKCVFVDQEHNANASTILETRFSFLIPAEECGTKFYDPGSTLSSKHDNGSQQPVNDIANEIYMENTVMFQKNHYIQEQGDLAQKLRCVWQKEIHRPLVAALPLTYRGKHVPKFTPEPIKKEKVYVTPAPVTTTSSSSTPAPIWSTPVTRNFTKLYLTASQQRHADLIRRFQLKGQVESVSFSTGRRRGKSLALRAPVAARQLKSNNELRSYRNPQPNFTALPFKADDSRSGAGKVAVFSPMSLCPTLLLLLILFRMPFLSFLSK